MNKIRREREKQSQRIAASMKRERERERKKRCQRLINGEKEKEPESMIERIDLKKRIV